MRQNGPDFVKRYCHVISVWWMRHMFKFNYIQFIRLLAMKHHALALWKTGTTNSSLSGGHWPTHSARATHKQLLYQKTSMPYENWLKRIYQLCARWIPQMPKQRIASIGAVEGLQKLPEVFQIWFIASSQLTSREYMRMSQKKKRNHFASRQCELTHMHFYA